MGFFVCCCLLFFFNEHDTCHSSCIFECICLSKKQVALPENFRMLGAGLSGKVIVSHTGSY